MTSDLNDPIVLAQALMRRPSVTPADEGALDVLQSTLEAIGFVCTRHPFGEVDNLYARLGDQAPNFCFAGHTDVVPVGDRDAWTVDPFAAEIRDGKLWGRGACDMKASIAAFVAAAARFVDANGTPKGSISLLITGDEEGPAIDGTRKLLPTIAEAGETLSHCLVGEPTSEAQFGDVVKNGRRGSLNGVARAIGRQGHAAYPDKAANPVPALIDFLGEIKGALDDGAPGFQPTNLEVTSIDVANPAHNVIPAEAQARFNIRFNTHHTGESLSDWLLDKAEAGSADGVSIDLDLRATGEAFYTAPSEFTALISSAIEAETGAAPRLTTGGGTSDARFIKDYCPVAELGLKNETAHQVDEHVDIADVEALCRTYHRILVGYFADL